MSEDVLEDICSMSDCKDKGTYVVKAYCLNCDWKGQVVITKGHEFSRQKQCPRCECRNTLQRVSNR